jgi:hypothetical protein
MLFPAASGSTFWGPVFALGPRGHYAIGAFLRAWFQQINETTEADAFGQRWRAMTEHVIPGPGWGTTGLWFHAHKLDRQVLGFADAERLARISGHAALLRAMRDLYKAWADKRLRGDEDNLAAFCNFLAQPGGAPLRLDGLVWIAAALEADPEINQWYRDRSAAAFMALLDAVVLENSDQLRNFQGASEAIVKLAALAVSRQLPAALALQERVKKLL